MKPTPTPGFLPPGYLVSLQPSYGFLCFCAVVSSTWGSPEVGGKS